jgi:hypothetical protein
MQQRSTLGSRTAAAAKTMYRGANVNSNDKGRSKRRELYDGNQTRHSKHKSRARVAIFHKCTQFVPAHKCWWREEMKKAMIKRREISWLYIARSSTSSRSTRERERVGRQADWAHMIYLSIYLSASSSHPCTNIHTKNQTPSNKQKQATDRNVKKKKKKTRNLCVHQ